jgi:hypothetical protein
LKSLIAQYAAYLLMRARRVALTEAEEAWVKELGDEVENMLDDIVQGNRAIKGLVRHAIEGGEEPSQLKNLVDPLLDVLKGKSEVEGS